MPLMSRGSVRDRLSVWFSLRSRALKSARLAFITSSPPRSNAASAASPCDHMNGGPAFRPRLGEVERAIGENKLGEPHLAPERLSGGPPSQSARDHEVDDDEEVALHAQHDSLAKAPDAR